MSHDVAVVKRGSCILVPPAQLAGRAKHGWKAVSELPAGDQQKLRDRFKDEPNYTAALKPATTRKAASGS